MWILKYFSEPRDERRILKSLNTLFKESQAAESCAQDIGKEKKRKSDGVLTCVDQKLFHCASKYRYSFEK